MFQRKPEFRFYSSSASSTLRARCRRVGSEGELRIWGAVVVDADAGAGWPGRPPREAIPDLLPEDPCLDFFFFFFSYRIDISVFSSVT